jgi:hypothetical protein
MRKIGTGKVQAKEATKAQGFQFRTSERAEFKPKHSSEPVTFSARRLTSDESMRKALVGHTVKEIVRKECTTPESVSFSRFFAKTNHIFCSLD